MLIDDPNWEPCTLAPPEAFSDELAGRDLRVRLRPGRDPGLVEEKSDTVEMLFASRCAGEPQPPKAAEFYYAIREPKPDKRQLHVLDSWVMHSTLDDLWWAWSERAYSRRMLVKAMHHVQLPNWKACRYVNAHAMHQEMVAADSLPVFWCE